MTRTRRNKTRALSIWINEGPCNKIEKRITHVKGDDTGEYWLHVLDELRVEERESHEFRLVQVHHEQLVGGCEIGLLAGELLVEIAHVLPVFLNERERARKINTINGYNFKQETIRKFDYRKTTEYRVVSVREFSRGPGPATGNHDAVTGPSKDVVRIIVQMKRNLRLDRSSKSSEEEVLLKRFF